MLNTLLFDTLLLVYQKYAAFYKNFDEPYFDC